MKNRFPKSVIALCIFFISVFVISFIYNRNYPTLILAGESSVGTWMSGVLLVMSATFSLIIALRTNSIKWILIFAFFLLLALDERFMFHERAKEFIVFSIHPTSKWMQELPVLVGAFAGMYIALVLWRDFNKLSRTLLLLAVLLGIFSVLIDVNSSGVIFEECFKLLAELLITCSLLKKVDEI